VGAVKNYDDNAVFIYWDIPYKPGKLEVVALQNQQPVTGYSIQSSG
jgi:hypothetical protein